MQSRALWIGVAAWCLVSAGTGRTETPEGLTKGLFTGQSVTLTLGSEEIAPFLREKGFGPGDTVRLTHKGHGRMNVARIHPNPPLRLTIGPTDYLSPAQVAERLTALGLQAEGAIASLGNGDSLTAIVTPAGAEASSLLGRRGFKAGDHVTVSNAKERLQIERLAPGQPLSFAVPLTGYLPAGAVQELSGALGFGATMPEPAVDVPPVAMPDDAQIQAEIAQAQAEFEQDILKANEGEVLTAVDFRRLKALLPDNLPDLQRVDASGERMDMMGANLATAHGLYAKDGDDETNIEIELMDLGNLSGFMRQGMVSWLGQSFHNTTTHGYTKTTERQGYPGIEEWDSERQAGTLQLHVAGRFLVSIEGQQVTMDAIHAAADRIDLKQLEALAATPSTSAAPSSTDDTVTSSEAGVSDMETMLAEMGQAGTGQPVDQDTLKPCLPAAAAGLKRVELEGQQHTMSGVTMASVEARYKGDGPGGISISIMDTATMAPEMRMGMAVWNIMDFDSETDTGYEKTTTFGKYRALETLDRTVSETSISVFVANRFYTSVTGKSVSVETVRQALGQVNLQKLETLAAR